MSDVPEVSSGSRHNLTGSHFRVMSHITGYLKEPFSLAFSASNPQCRSLAETFGSDRLAKINLTHISTFNAANHCGVGLHEKYNVVRVPCSPFRRAARSRYNRLWRPSSDPDGTGNGLVMLLDPPSESIISGPTFNAVVVHSVRDRADAAVDADAEDAIGRAGPSFEVLPCPKEDMPVRDPVDHTYPFNTTRGVFSLEGLGDLEGGEHYGQRQGCVQNYLDSLRESGNSRAMGDDVYEIVLVFLWVEREQGDGAHQKAIQHLDHALWWLGRNPPDVNGRRQRCAPVFLHVYNVGNLSLFRYLLSSVPAVHGLMCIHSPWFAAEQLVPAAEGEGTPKATTKDDDPFAPHDRDLERYVDIGSALRSCDDPVEVERLAALRYFGVSATPLTSAGLKALTERLTSLRHLAIYLNHASEFDSIGCLGALPHLGRLMVHTCPSLTHLRGIEESTSIVELSIASCIQLSSITPLTALPSLQTLRINGCASVEPSPFMETILYSTPLLATANGRREHHGSALQQLSYLQLSELDNICDNLSALRFLPLLTALDLHLTATDNNAVVVIAKNCTQLQALSLAECFVISEIEPLAVLPFLSHLLLRNTTISDASLSRFCHAQPQSLRVLDVSECDDLTNCSCVSKIPTLTRINAQGTRITTESVYDLVKDTVRAANAPRTSGLSLATVDLRGCPQLKNISAVFSK